MRIVSRLAARLEQEEKGYRQRTAMLLTETAVRIRRAEIAAMPRQLDRPTPFTKKGVLFRPAKERTLLAVVYIRPIQAKYLAHQVFGTTGTRPKPVPASGFANKYGNLPRGATRRKKIFSVTSKRTGKRYVFKAAGKGRKTLIATWSKQRAYKKNTYNFFGIATRVGVQVLRHGKTILRRRRT